MRSASLVIVVFLISVKGICQPATPLKCYHQCIQYCNVISNFTTDYTLELFSDSTIRVAEYRSSSEDQHLTITGSIYTGTYQIEKDTLNIVYLNKKVTTSAKPLIRKETIRWYPKDPGERNPCRKFVMMKNYIAAADNAYPTLKKVGNYSFRLIESKLNENENGR